MENKSRKLNSKASKSLKFIIYELENDRTFNEADIDYEYSSFEESVKDYCDGYIREFLDSGENEEAFNSLSTLTEAISNVEDDMSEEDYFRPVELITYYFAKTITLSDGTLTNRIYTWMYNFVEENEGMSMIAENYFRVFLEGRMIYHADRYYTDYADYEKVLSYYK